MRMMHSICGLTIRNQVWNDDIPHSFELMIWILDRFEDLYELTCSKGHHGSYFLITTPLKWEFRRVSSLSPCAQRVSSAPPRAHEKSINGARSLVSRVRTMVTRNKHSPPNTCNSCWFVLYKGISIYMIYRNGNDAQTTE
jgi:hypothetical protein